MKFLQLNLGRGKEAQDFLMQTARERRDDVFLIGDQHKWSENSAWYQDASRRAGILVCSPDLSIEDFLKTDAGFVWLEVAGVRVYSCYFSPGDPCEIFDTQILLLEDHQYIEFNIRERSHPVNARRGGKGRSPSRNTRRLSKDKLQKHLKETRLIDELGWAKSAGSLEDTVRAARRKMIAACDHSVPRRGHGRTGDSMYWWNDQLSVLRRECFAARRRFTPSKGDSLLHEAWKKANSALRKRIKKSQLQCWKDLIGEVEKDPWGLAFKTPGFDNPDRVKNIVRSLFSHVEPFQRQDRSSCVVRREELSKN